jgi:chemotaxis response regulator CheB/chemotaxis methyl-accepting protein methylase
LVIRSGTTDFEEAVYALAERMTGSCQQGSYRRSILVSNVEQRLIELGLDTLDEYLRVAKRDESERARLLSALTIHTTSWFREFIHFQKMEAWLTERKDEFRKRPLRVLSAACSTGEEPYSFALVLEHFRLNHGYGWFEYLVYGNDIDPMSVEKGQRGIYPVADIDYIPRQYRTSLRMGSDKAYGLFMPTPDIKRRCLFANGDLRALTKVADADRFDIIVCRNVLIYFSPSELETIIEGLVQRLQDGGYICLGHCETVEGEKLGLQTMGNSCYERIGKPVERHAVTRVLVVDDSPTARLVISRAFRDSGFEVQEADTAEEARNIVEKKLFDVITLDLHLPDMLGSEWLIHQRGRGLATPVAVVSDLHAEDADMILSVLQTGAQDFIEKSHFRTAAAETVARVKALVREVSRSAFQERVTPIRTEIPDADLIVIGASTGGTEVLTRILCRMPSYSPPVVVVQHISHAFAVSFAERLAAVSELTLGRCIDGEPLQRGSLYLARGDHHLGVRGANENLGLQVSHAAPVRSHRPSVDTLFLSAAKLTGTKIFAALLTGMGSDGAEGLLALRKKGAFTCAQDEESCTIFGMPKEAIRLRAAALVGSPSEIRSAIEKASRPKRAAKEEKRSFTIGGKA